MIEIKGDLKAIKSLLSLYYNLKILNDSFLQQGYRLYCGKK